MNRYALLPQLPLEIAFPPGLSRRVSYDPQRRELRFQGHMSKHDYDTLVALSSDREYQAALAELFRVCTGESGQRQSSAWPFAGCSVAAGAAFIMAALLVLVAWSWLRS